MKNTSFLSSKFFILNFSFFIDNTIQYNTIQYNTIQYNTPYYRLTKNLLNYFRLSCAGSKKKEKLNQKIGK